MLSGLRHYKGGFSGIAITAATDLLEFNSASGKLTWVKRVELAQYTDFGDAQAEILPLIWIQDHSTSGSGGSTITPTPDSGVSAYSGTVERNNTTVATGGSPLSFGPIAWNVAAGYVFAPDPTGWILVPSGGRLVLNMGAPADSITCNLTFWIAEAG